MMEKLSAKEFDANYKTILEKLDKALLKTNKSPSDVILLAATKTVDVDTINYAISKGINFIGENRVQEFLSKYDMISPVHKHFIGHLQTNKVAKLVGTVSMIQSVSSEKLALEISKRSIEKGIVTPVLLEVNIGEEESKTGAKPKEMITLCEKCSQMEGIKVEGLMAIPPICQETDEMRQIFSNIYRLFIDIREKNIDNIMMTTLSMGMSSDYELAIEEGATMVRVGSSLFGKRIYK